jgi:RsiW-degrading membrane proteinase PrsW (M82 family)
VRRWISLLLLAVSLGWLFFEAPGPFLREAWFVAVVLGATIATRSVPWNLAVSGLALGIGVAAPVMVAFGWLLARAGFDVSEGGPLGWTVVPVVEEALKLGVVVMSAWLYRRRSRLSFNPSDWLLVGCSVGAGFAMVENAQLVAHDSGVLRDMARQYGPSLLVPGAWGLVGFVGHAAATGLAAAGVGLWMSFKRMPGTRIKSFASIALLAPMAWVTLEHVLANHRVDTGSELALLLGNGRLTPWLFLLVAALVIAGDLRLGNRAIARSRIFRMRRAATRELLLGNKIPKRRTLWQRLNVATREQRLVNTAAWAMLEDLLKEGKSR